MLVVFSFIALGLALLAMVLTCFLAYRRIVAPEKMRLSWVFASLSAVAMFGFIAKILIDLATSA